MIFGSGTRGPERDRSSRGEAAPFFFTSGEGDTNNESRALATSALSSSGGAAGACTGETLSTGGLEGDPNSGAGAPGDADAGSGRSNAPGLSEEGPAKGAVLGAAGLAKGAGNDTRGDNEAAVTGSAAVAANVVAAGGNVASGGIVVSGIVVSGSFVAAGGAGGTGPAGGVSDRTLPAVSTHSRASQPSHTTPASPWAALAELTNNVLPQ